MGKNGAIARETKLSIGLSILMLVALFSFRFLLDGNLGTGAQNEGDVLPLARQYVDPGWVPGDWYLNQPPGYRRLFQDIFGRLIVTIGFLATSLLGRLLCYGLVAWGMVRIARQIGLRLPGLLLAGLLLLYLGRQSVVAKEWILGGLEAKSIAYGLVILAIALLLEGRYRWMALLLGVATSFHVLVGGWAFLTVCGWLALHHWRGRSLKGETVGVLLLVYAVGSLFALPPVLEQLLTPAPSGTISPTYLYVFVRLPHHLNPPSWNSDWWVRPAVYLLLLLLTVGWLRHRQSFEKQPDQYQAQMGLAKFTGLSLIPFAIGLLIAPFDSQGTFLQYYPFRLGDVMLPLNGCLLFACAIERTCTGRSRQAFVLACLLLLAWSGSGQVDDFQKQVQAVTQFPGEEQRVTPELQDLYTWIRTNTPQDATLISPPTELYNLTWLTERPTIAKYKFFPQSKAGILAWYERLSDLSGSTTVWQLASPRKDARDEIRDVMERGYNSLSTEQAIRLMDKYQSNYFVTQVGQSLTLPVAYHNAQYLVYQKPEV